MQLQRSIKTLRLLFLTPSREELKCRKQSPGSQGRLKTRVGPPSSVFHPPKTLWKAFTCSILVGRARSIKQVKWQTVNLPVQQKNRDEEEQINICDVKGKFKITLLPTVNTAVYSEMGWNRRSWSLPVQMAQTSKRIIRQAADTFTSLKHTLVPLGPTDH